MNTPTRLGWLLLVYIVIGIPFAVVQWYRGTRAPSPYREQYEQIIEDWGSPLFLGATMVIWPWLVILDIQQVVRKIKR